MPCPRQSLAHSLCDLYAPHHACAHKRHKHAPATVLQLAVLGALTKGWAITQCKVDPVRCTEAFPEYKVVVNIQLASNTTAMNTNRTDGIHVEQHAVLSSLDAMSSCNTIIVVLCLQMYHECHSMCAVHACLRVWQLPRLFTITINYKCG